GGGAQDLAVFQDLGLFSNGSSVANETEVLKSRFITEKVVEELDLQKVYWDKNSRIGFKEVEIYDKRPFTVQFHDSVRVSDFVLHVKISNDQKIELKYSVKDEKGKESYRVSFGEIVALPFVTLSVEKTDVEKSGDFEMV